MRTARAARADLRTRQVLRAAARLMGREGADAVSMQAIADEAGVSVGLIYKYFGNKQDLVLAITVQVLDDVAMSVPAAVDRAGDDAVLALAAGFRAYCETIDEHRHAAVLTYRESKTLGADGQSELKRREVATMKPLVGAVRRGIDAGLFTAVDAELMTYDLVMLAHAWALKHWYFERSFDLEAYVTHQTAIVLGGLIVPERRADYPALLRPSAAPHTTGGR
ncbi:TetR/AcrR family transcriptional regulator [Microbacterium sp. ASV49]|uniref:TetR/AcrR family transcriptional regulator n=1 Tax=Microbacterium candidum TaxID=3041922 RepID=A0ABT7MW77_9MICO|nr:TetR/AcrR family transcriptional regulator [Microbacterium sp. ASV49]MDL9978673.1 TetR/AcrR family transcriptional regulator [Microbacterium sp. ASV49]